MACPQGYARRIEVCCRSCGREQDIFVPDHGWVEAQALAHFMSSPNNPACGACRAEGSIEATPIGWPACWVCGHAAAAHPLGEGATRCGECPCARYEEEA